VKKLSVAIPTYNKCHSINYFLETHLEVFQKKGIKIYIFNNSSSDGTKEVLATWLKRCDQIKLYEGTGEPLTYDDSARYIIEKVEEDYVWLVGDTYYLNPSLIEEVIKNLNKGYDFLILNLQNRLHKKNIEINDRNIVLSNYAHVMACISTTVFNKKMIRYYDGERFKGLQYIHLAITLEHISKAKFNAKYIGSQSIYPLKSDSIKTNWLNTKDSLEIITKLWVSLVDRLPDTFNKKSIDNAYKVLITITKTDRYRYIALMRYNDALTLKNVVRLRKYVIKAYGIRAYKLLPMLLVPRYIFSIVCNMRKISQNKNLASFCAKREHKNIF